MRSPTIADLLDDTPAFAVGERPVITRGSEATPSPVSSTEENPWSFSSVQGSEGPAIRGLRCRVPHGDHLIDAAVADEISWSAPQITFGTFRTTVDLPLDAEHQIGALHASGINGLAPPVGGCSLTQEPFRPFRRWWPVRFHFSAIRARLYGFEFRQGRWGPWSPKAVDRLLADESVGWEDLQELRFLPAEVAVERRHVFPRVLVTTSMAVCRPAADFDPLGAMVSCRLFPTVHLRANFHLLEASASIRLVRPEIGQHPMSGGEPMASPMKSVLFTDRNESWLFSPVPTWDEIFGWYELQPCGPYQVVNRSRKKGTFGGQYRQRWDHDLNVYLDAPVTTEPRQGDFDNLHIAPPFYFEGKEVVMAPVCHHDCLHVHWRWGTGATVGLNDHRKQMGFAGQSPNEVPGAPMVPEGQEVTVMMDKANALHYSLTQYDVPPSSPVVGFHHGATYAHHIKPFTRFVTGLFRPEFESEDHDAAWNSWEPLSATRFELGVELLHGDASLGSWYHYLRFADKAGTIERLRLPSGVSPFLQRGLPPAPEEAYNVTMPGP